jgi:hypothetical protein
MTDCGRWWVAAANRLSDGIRQAAALLSRDSANRQTFVCRFASCSLNRRTCLRVPSVPILSHGACAFAGTSLRTRSNQPSMIPQNWVGRDINRGLAVACLILTRQTVRASSDEQEKDEFVTRVPRCGFRAFFTRGARKSPSAGDSIGACNVPENMGESLSASVRKWFSSLPTLTSGETFGRRTATHLRLRGAFSRKDTAVVELERVQDA